MLKRKNLIGFMLWFVILIGLNNSRPKEVNASDLRTSVSLTPVADTFVTSKFPDQNQEHRDYLDLTYDDPDLSASLLRFDLGSLPSNAVVIYATLRLYLISHNFFDEVDLTSFFITSHWDEDVVTWNSSPSTSMVGFTTSIDNYIGDYKSISIPSSFAQNWIDDPLSNNGVVIRPSSSNENFYSQYEGSEMINPPYLDITYLDGSAFDQLGGRVYKGPVGEESQPIEGVQLSLYCSTSSGDLGTQIDTTTTDSTGWYGLKGYAGCNYYTIIETDPSGYISTGATTVDGVILSPNMIQYQAPLSGQIHTGNKFWDQLDTNGFDIFLPLIIK